MAVPMKPSAHSHKSSLFTKLGTLVIGKGLARGEKGEWPAGMLRTPTNWEAQAALISLSLSLSRWVVFLGFSVTDLLLYVTLLRPCQTSQTCLGSSYKRLLSFSLDKQVPLLPTLSYHPQ